MKRGMLIVLAVIAIISVVSLNTSAQPQAPADRPGIGTDAAG